MTSRERKNFVARQKNSRRALPSRARCAIVNLADLWDNLTMIAGNRESTPNELPTNNVKLELRLRLPLVWLGVLLVTAVFLPDRVWNTLLVGFGGMFLLAYGWTRLLIGGLHASRRLRFGWVSVGDRLSEQFELVNQSAIPALSIDSSPVLLKTLKFVDQVLAVSFWVNVLVNTNKVVVFEVQLNAGPVIQATSDWRFP